MAISATGILYSIVYRLNKAAGRMIILYFIFCNLAKKFDIHGKTIALTRWTFFGKVMYLLFNMLFRLVIAFLPRSKHLLISWLQSPCAVILEPKKISMLIIPLFKKMLACPRMKAFRIILHAN